MKEDEWGESKRTGPNQMDPNLFAWPPFRQARAEYALAIGSAIRLAYTMLPSPHLWTTGTAQDLHRKPCAPPLLLPAHHPSATTHSHVQTQPGPTLENTR